MGCQKISPACVTKTPRFLPVFTVLAVVFIWQSGKVMWRAVFSAIFEFFLFYFLDFVDID